VGKKIKIDGKEWDLNDFDDSRSWGKLKQDKGFYAHMKIGSGKIKKKICRQKAY
jgi:hypothetical protein